ncbi:Protein kinase PKN PRK1, effector [Musa troglodytarum]|uniref:Protein kinase PKN PRK1, effector n=3 Tax=Musa troglodytarum TaxID=320322 RepID=A0A9E7HPT1_9LILI|nr:Protein kinase PKN PRK1, effector [Musa troglodytarum]URE34900.1 Protein kinase PKN PRK1, effector [Musa troglodytarum]URE34902.1 Protein kinase PKN PRK1, effector [Musa troglodytarum]URE34903.1 Protein kinase PKN PRK1, effector [Musa troglodytarum]
MAGRNRMPRHPMNEGPHGFRDGPPLRGPLPLHPVEEELAIRHDEIRRLQADNRLLMEENVALRREIDFVKNELLQASQAIPKLRSDKELESRELIQRGLPLGAELRAREPLREEAIQLKSEAQKLDALRQELSGKVQALQQDLTHLQTENQQLPTLQIEIDGLRQELIRARTTYEYETKANAEQLEQRQAMEKNLVSMAREVEKLRAEMEKRARGPGSGAYGGVHNASSDISYPALFRDGYASEKGFYGTGPWASDEPRGFPRH